MRLFIAVRLSDAMKDSLITMQHTLHDRGVRGNYTSEENLHLTLAFIGEYPDAETVLDALASEPSSFDQFLHFLKILNDLAESEEARVLASSSFAHADRDKESRRILKVKQFISEHAAEEIRLETLASLAGMAPSAFSRFFRQRTGRTVVDYIIDVRLGNAARMLVDTAQNISEICYACGFNNLSNFNRIFKAKRGYTPRDFRTIFRKKRVFV